MPHFVKAVTSVVFKTPHCVNEYQWSITSFKVPDQTVAYLCPLLTAVSRPPIIREVPEEITGSIHTVYTSLCAYAMPF